MGPQNNARTRARKQEKKTNNNQPNKNDQNGAKENTIAK